MPVRYTKKQDEIAGAIAFVGFMSSVVSIAASLVATIHEAYRALAVSVPVALIALVSLLWSARVQWRYAGQTEGGK